MAAAAALNIQNFTLEIAEGSNGSIGYHNLIVDLRRKAGTSIVHDLPVLPLATKTPTDFLDVKLKTTSTKEITARFRRDNLYLIGYLPSPQGRWYEFSDTSLIPGAIKLKDDGSYITLERIGTARKDIPLSYHEFRVAVDYIADKGAQNQLVKELARSLIIIIEAIAESMRSTILCEFFRSNWEHEVSIKPTGRIIILENSWSAISKAIMQNSTVTDRTIATAITDGAGTPTLQDCINVTGVLLRKTD
ncbi:hypothetical protein TWF718_008278 [Orbilia javanica]|uniref:Uncharacterized protein n=1 Tax=Orbilia javanica TaxID=47235 RepID=A0AAN8RCB7_9PEZI